jgi:hypothetical protein
MAKYTIVSKGELKKAGSYLKQIITVVKPDGQEQECFTWVNDEAQAAEIAIGDILDGTLSYTEPTNPKYKREWKLGKWEKVGSGASVPARSAPVSKGVSLPSGDKDERIARGNACNAVCSLHAGKATEPGELYAEIRQMYIYITTGVIPEMSTKVQHEAIVAMFTKDENGKRSPDIEAARSAVNEYCGVPFVSAMTLEEGKGFLASMTPD